MGHVAAFPRPPSRLRYSRKVLLRVTFSHLVPFPCSPCMRREQLETISLIQKSTTRDPVSGLPVESMSMGMDWVWARFERKETIHATFA